MDDTVSTISEVIQICSYLTLALMKSYKKHNKREIKNKKGIISKAQTMRLSKLPKKNF